MSSTDALLDLIILVLVALVPALIYLSWVRNTERFQTTSLGPILGAFIYGALFATIVAAILEAVIVGLGTSVSQTYPGPEFLFLNGNSSLGAFFLVLVVAPFIEEGLKGSGSVLLIGNSSSPSRTGRSSARPWASGSDSSRRSSTVSPPTWWGASPRGSR